MGLGVGWGDYSHRKKRMRQLQKKIKNGTLNIKQDDPFELFVAATNIRYCYYSETHKILGNTFGMCVLQVGDFPQPAPGGRALRGARAAWLPMRTEGQRGEKMPVYSPSPRIYQWKTWPFSQGT